MRIFLEKCCKISAASGAPHLNPCWPPATGVSARPDSRVVTFTY